MPHSPNLPPAKLPPPAADPRWRRAVRRRLAAWYATHARDLPWRRSRDPYRVWLSETMLQQTQVATVEGYFARFLERFPDIAALASAKEEDVLRVWEGLGYYRRARQLHAAARLLVDEYHGAFPRTVEGWRRLPGVGRYTAGAVVSIAFARPAPILEANTARLFSRLIAFEGEVSSADGERLLWSLAAALVPRKEPGVFNQAAMELGGQVCRSRLPQCVDCPLEDLCAARRRGRTETIPRPKRRPAIEQRYEAALLVRRQGRVLLVRIPEGRRWAGLWDFPRFQLAGRAAEDPAAALAAEIEALNGMAVRVEGHLLRLRHAVTRYRITLDCFAAKFLGNGGTPAAAPEVRWIRPAELDRYPLSTTGRRLARLV